MSAESLPLVCSVESEVKNGDFVYKYVDSDMHRDAFAVMNELRMQNTFCDFTIKVGDRKYLCHRIVLSATVPYFRTMLSSSFQETSKGELEFPAHYSTNMDAIIKYLYLGFIKITSYNVIEIIEIANYLGIDSLADACVTACMKGLVYKNNVLNILFSAKELNISSVIIDVCNNYVNNNFDEIIKTVEFLSAEINLLIDIIKSDQLQVNEECVWEAVVRWVRHDEGSRGSVLPKLMKYIRFDLINPTYLWRTIAKDDLLRNSAECKDYIYEVLGTRLCENDVKGLNPSRRRFQEGDICVLGGRSSHHPYIRREVLEYSAETGRWRSGSIRDMPEEIVGLGAVVVNNTIFAVGGYTREGITAAAQKYNLHEGDWADITSLNKSRHRLGVCAVHSHIYACGGEGAIGESLNTVERYDPGQDRWVFATSMNDTREGPGIVYMDGSIWAVGGLGQDKILNTVERFDPRDGYWVRRKPMLTSRHLHGSVVLGNKIYVCGGLGIEFDSIEEYDPRNNKWSFLAPMKNVRSQFPLVVYKGKIWAIGGDHSDTVGVYDVKTYEWSEAAPLGCSLLGHSAVVIPRLFN